MVTPVLFDLTQLNLTNWSARFLPLHDAKHLGDVKLGLGISSTVEVPPHPSFLLGVSAAVPGFSQLVMVTNHRNFQQSPVLLPSRLLTTLSKIFASLEVTHLK